MRTAEDIAIIGDTIRIEGETLERLDELAALLGVTLHEALRTAVSSALAEASER